MNAGKSASKQKVTADVKIKKRNSQGKKGEMKENNIKVEPVGTECKRPPKFSHYLIFVAARQPKQFFLARICFTLNTADIVAGVNAWHTLCEPGVG